MCIYIYIYIYNDFVLRFDDKKYIYIYIYIYICLLLPHMFIPCHQKAEQNHMMIINEHRLTMYEKKDGEVKDDVRRDGWKKRHGELHNMFFTKHYYVQKRRSRKEETTSGKEK